MNDDASYDPAVGKDRTYMNHFPRANQLRCEEDFRHKFVPEDFDEGAVWGRLEWAVAIAGEAGELCNLIKKWRRGDHIPNINDKIAEELADVITYCDLLMQYIGRDTEEELVKKFNKVSKRIDSRVHLVYPLTFSRLSGE